MEMMQDDGNRRQFSPAPKRDAAAGADEMTPPAERRLQGCGGMDLHAREETESASPSVIDRAPDGAKACHPESSTALRDHRGMKVHPRAASRG
jgi:hypothetical protein